MGECAGGPTPHTLRNFDNPSSQGDPLDRCVGRELVGSLGDRGRHISQISSPLHSQSNIHAHHTKENTRGHLFINHRPKTMPLRRNVLAKNRFHTDQISRKQRIKKGKLNEPVRQVPAQLAGGAPSGGRVCTEGDQMSGRTFEDKNNTEQLDHPESCPGEAVAPDGPPSSPP